MCPIAEELSEDSSSMCIHQTNNIPRKFNGSFVK